MSSTYLIHRLGTILLVARACFSNCSMYTLATTGESGDPIAAPAPQFSKPPHILWTIHNPQTRYPTQTKILKGSPTHHLAKELTRILSPLSGITESHVKNSAEFVERIKKEPVEKGDMMVSFDVITLFTKVLLYEALQCIMCILKDDHMLDDRTALSIPDICQLIDLCLRSTYFVF